MHASSLVSRVTFALAGLGSLATAMPGGGTCPADSHCYLPRWVPAAAVGGETYGHQVEIDGDTAAVSGQDGAPVAIYERVGNTWVETQSLPSPSGFAGDEFGWALSLQGDRLAVGAPKDSTFAVQNGAVHRFERVDGVWAYDSTVYDPTPEASERFGYHVDVDGQWLGVSSYGNSPTTTVRAFFDLAGEWVSYALVGVYESGPGGVPIAVHELEAELTVQFAVGVPASDLQAANGGRAELVTVSPAGVDAQAVPAPSLDTNDAFGFSISFDGATLALGSPRDDEAANNAGAVYLYEVGPEPLPSLLLVEKLLPCGDASSAFFGGAVDLRGTRIAVGASTQSTELVEPGAAYLFAKGAFGAWSTVDRITAADGAPFVLFGGNVALTDDAILVGADYASGPGPLSGAAYFVSLNSDLVPGGECPCESLAGNKSYGEGKPGSAGVPELEATEAPVPGEATLIRLTDALVGTTPFLFWGTVPAAMPFDGGTLLVGDLNVATMPIVGPLGQVGLQWKVSPNPAFCGLEIFAQAFMLDPGAGGQYSTAQSNGLHLTVGY